MKIFGRNVTFEPLYFIIPNLSDNCVYCLEPIYKNNDSRVSYCTTCHNVFHPQCNKKWTGNCPICREGIIRRYWFGSNGIMRLCNYLYYTFKGKYE